MLVQTNDFFEKILAGKKQIGVTVFFCSFFFFIYFYVYLFLSLPITFSNLKASICYNFLGLFLSTSTYELDIKSGLIEFISACLRKNFFKKLLMISPTAITYSKLTIETLEQGVKYVQS